MAAVPSSPETLIPKSTSTPPSTPQPSAPDPSASVPQSSATAPQPPPHPDTATSPNPNPNPNTTPAVVAPPLPQFTPSFRPVGAPQFSHVVPSTFQNPAFPVPGHSLQPPGVAPGAAYSVSGATGGVAMPVQPVPSPGIYYAPPGQPPVVGPRSYWQVPNGYAAAPTAQAPGMMVPPGVPRYPAPYPSMVRPSFPPRLPMPINVIPTISRPPTPVIGGAPIVPTMMRPLVPIIAPQEKPQTTVYVGKIASTVENNFLLPLLEFCGPVKNWKPAQNPSDGTLRGFGFCEFESAEGVLRALRLLSKLNLDGQELVLNVNKATREYLERYIEKKTEKEKLKEAESDPINKEIDSLASEKQENKKEETEKNADNVEGKDKEVDIHKFGIVTDEDSEKDREALEKLKNMIEERLKAKPLPPPPPVGVDGSAKMNSELPSKSRDGSADADADAGRSDEDITSVNKATSENDKLDEYSSDKARRHERSREREERDLKREKERELERYERERERERIRRERERDIKLREAERIYRDRVKEWEAREREKEHQRHRERDREKESESKRHREIMDQEDESDDDDTRKRRRRGGTIEEKRRRRQREKEEDLADRLKEEEEIIEARKRAAEEARKRAAEELECKQKLKEDSERMAVQMITENGGLETEEDKMDITDSENVPDKGNDNLSVPGENIQINGSNEEFNILPEVKQNNITSRKLGFGLVASGKKSIIPSIFNEEEDEDTEDKKMRPFVPIDYTEDLDAAQNTSETPANLVAAAEYAKRISGSGSKDERAVLDSDRSRRSVERYRERVRIDDSHRHNRDDGREQVREKNIERDRGRDNKKLLDAKQLIDTIPKTKEELFSYNINWAVYDKHELHERMRPWITKKIIDFLGEEETSLVDYIVSSTNNHVKASDMLELLQSILDEEAEMFVLKMWRMLIFEIKKVETGLSLKSKT